MGRSRKPVQPSDDAAIARALRTDSEILRYAEWWVRRRVYGLNDAETRYLRDRYIESYRNLLSTLPDAYDSEGKPVLAQRAQLLAQIERELGRLMGATAAGVETALFDGFKQGYYGRAWLLDQVTVPEWTANYNVLLPNEAIRAALLQEYIGTNEWFSGEREVLTAAVKRSVTNSLITGEGMTQAAARLRRELGIQPGQKGAFKGSMYRTMLITRTEIMRASNLGALTIYEQNQDVLSGWEWVASRDERVCPQCGALDGRVFKFGDPMLQPPSGSHPGCRCTVVPVLRDTELMDRINGGPRETYADWAFKQGIIDDGNLAGQRTASPPSNQK